jgi:hypothetical protein
MPRCVDFQLKQSRKKSILILELLSVQWGSGLPELYEVRLNGLDVMVEQ